MSVMMPIDEKKAKQLPIVGEKPASEKEEKWLRDFIVCEFYNLEEQGAPNRSLYGDTKHNVRLNFWHGGKYRIPRYIKRHFENCHTPIYDYHPDGTGKLVKKFIGKKSRFQFREVMEM